MKLSIICAMAHKPKLMILDEATMGLAPVVQRRRSMKGLIYKDITIFFKSIDKKLVLIAVGVITLLIVNIINVTK